MTAVGTPSSASALAMMPAPRSPLEKAISLLTQMETVREPKLARWRDCEAYITPYSSNVDRQLQRTGVAPEVLDESIFYCHVTFQAFLASAMTNPSRTWSEWALPDPELRESAAAKDWLHTVNTRRMMLLAQSNFYESMTWVYGEWPVFATAAVLIEEDEADVFRYVPLEIGSYALADDARGNAVAVSRRFKMTVRQIVERFATVQMPDGTKRVDRSVLSLRLLTLMDANKLEDEVEIAHLICPNHSPRPNSGNPQHFPFASYYWEWGVQPSMRGAGNGGFLAHEGYQEWPVMVFRWKRLAGDPWGTNSPGYLTLGAVKSAQAMESDLLMMVEKQVKPPLQVPTGMVNVNLLPAAVNKNDSLMAGRAAQPLHQTDPAAIQQAREAQDRVLERLYALWFTRLILSANQRDSAAGRSGGSTQPRTAREIEEISAEKFQIMGPIVEAAAPALRVGSDREFAIMARRGFLPPAPPEIQGMPLTIEYTSALAIAQKSVGLSGLLDYGMQMAQMINLVKDPSIARRTDWSEWAQAVGDRIGLPPKVQRTDDEVAEIAEAEAQAQAEVQRAEVMALEAGATKDLADAPLGEDTALDATLAATGAGGAGGGP